MTARSCEFESHPAHEGTLSQDSVSFLSKVYMMKPLQTGYISGVNMARVFGAIGIVVFHYGCHNDFLPFLRSSANESWGRILVALFLIISGACMARTYATHFEWKDYCIRRWKAIFPVFYITYLFFAIEHTINYGRWWYGIPGYRIIYTVLGIDGFIPFDRPNFYLVGEWFIGALIACYILFPALLWLLKRIPLVTGALLLVGTWFIPFLPCFTGDPFQNLWTCTTLFYLGMLIAQSPMILSNKVSFGVSTAILLFLLVFQLPFYGYLRLFGSILTGALLFVSLTNLGRMCEEGAQAKTVLSQLGKLSFPMFLVQHILILRVMIHWGGDSVLTATGGLLMAIAASMLLAWIITLIHERIMLFFSRRNG